MEIRDDGHIYELKCLDGVKTQQLVYVKRKGIKYPGNSTSYAGTTSQEVLRTVIDRYRYVQNQVWCIENVIGIFCISISIWLLEFRAARRRSETYWHGLSYAEKSDLCDVCGHTGCYKHRSKEPLDGNS